MSERPTSSGRPAGSEDEPPSAARAAGKRVPLDTLTRAQARALSRCAPLTPAEFRERGRVAEEGLVSLREMLDQGADKTAKLDADSR